MFTSYYKQINKFGMINVTDAPSNKNTAQAYTATGYLVYINDKLPIFGAQFGYGLANAYSQPNGNGGWVASKEPVSDDHFVNNSFISASYTSTQYNDDGSVICRLTLSNNTSSDIQCKSVGYAAYMPFSSSSGGSLSRNTYIGLIMFNNIENPITIPANDSVFVDITLAAGDISEVSEG